MILSWQQISSTIISEILCDNFDGVVLDTEHGCFGNESLYACIQIVTCKQKKCFVRLTEVNKTLIRMCLDAGADGLIFSTIETEDQAKDIASACRFPKHGGLRGLGLVRQNFWGRDRLVSDPPIIIAQIETETGINNLDNIVKYNFDYYMVGPYDLSASLGFPGEFDNSRYLDMINRFKSKIDNEKMAVHIPDDIEGQISKYRDYGLIALGMDTLILKNGYSEVIKNA